MGRQHIQWVFEEEIFEGSAGIRPSAGKHLACGGVNGALPSSGAIKQPLSTFEAGGCALGEAPFRESEQHDRVESVWQRRVRIGRESRFDDCQRIVTIAIEGFQGSFEAAQRLRVRCGR